MFYYVREGSEERGEGGWVCYSVQNMLRNRCFERQKESLEEKYLKIEDKFFNIFLLFIEVKIKLFELVGLYDNICQLFTVRSKDFEDTLEVSEKFWEDYNNLCSTVKDFQDQIIFQDFFVLEFVIIREQQDFLEVKWFVIVYLFISLQIVVIWRDKDIVFYGCLSIYLKIFF